MSRFLGVVDGSDFLEDFVRGLGPDERVFVAVPGDELADLRVKVLDAGEGAAWMACLSMIPNHSSRQQSCGDASPRPAIRKRPQASLAANAAEHQDLTLAPTPESVRP